MSDAKIGHGCTFKIESDDSPGVMVSIGEINSITMPQLGRDAVEVTHMASTEKWREFIAGLKDGGEVSAEVNFVPGSAGSILLFAQMDSDELTTCEIGLPTTPAYEWTFDAILTGLPSEAPLDDKMTVEVTFKITGKPTLAVAS